MKNDVGMLQRVDVVSNSPNESYWKEKSAISRSTIQKADRVGYEDEANDEFYAIPLRTPAPIGPLSYRDLRSVYEESSVVRP